MADKYEAMDALTGLAHHGIIGMHWGIRRYQPYSKGQKKGKEVGDAALARKEIRAIKKTANAYYKVQRKIDKGKKVDAETRKEYDRLTKELHRLPKEARKVADQKIARAKKLYVPKKVAKIVGGIVAVAFMAQVARQINTHINYNKAWDRIESGKDRYDPVSLAKKFAKTPSAKDYERAVLNGNIKYDRGGVEHEIFNGKKVNRKALFDAIDSGAVKIDESAFHDIFKRKW